MKARYFDPSQTDIIVSLADGDALGNMRGPIEFALSVPSPGNAEFEALMRLVEDGTETIAPFAPPVAPLPDISDRQFAQVLALDGVITEDEALGWAARGDLPKALIDAIAQLPAAQRFPARMLLSAATTYERAHPMVPVLGALLGMDAAALDSIWTRGAAL